MLKLITCIGLVGLYRFRLHILQFFRGRIPAAQANLSTAPNPYQFSSNLPPKLAEPAQTHPSPSMHLPCSYNHESS